MVAAPTPILILVLVGSVLLLVLLVSAWVLHRSWENFPSQPDYRLLEQATPPRSPSDHKRSPLQPADLNDDGADEPLSSTVPDSAELLGDHDGEYIQIHSPLLIQVIRQAQQQGNRFTHHIVEEGEHIYLALHTIPNPQERQRVAQLIDAFQSGNHVGVWEMIDLMAQLGKGARPFHR